MLITNRTLKRIASALLLVVPCLMLSSFSERPGGENFEIYLGNKLMIQQFVTRDAGVKTLPLNEANSNDMLRIHYNHCGKTGVGRSITIRNAENKTLKSWHFPDAEGTSTSYLTFAVRDILAVQKSNAGKTLNLFYSSKEIPNGKLLASLAVSDDRASLK